MYKDKISGVYKITNNVTGEFYVGSSVNVKKRWKDHKQSSTWKAKPNSLLYKAMQEYGLECFSFEILKEVEPENLRQAEQRFIEMLKPTYNNYNAKGLNVERRKANHKKSINKYSQSEKGKVVSKKASKKYKSQLCLYNGETLKLGALVERFRRAGISHPNIEAKRYLTNNK